MMINNFEEYLKAISAQYEITKSGRDFDLLDKPSPAKLKKLCLRIIDRGCKQKDNEIFANFFETKDSLAGFISNMDAEELKTPSNFLRTGKPITQVLHADIIATLVDLEPRPFKKFQDEINKEKTTSIATETTDEKNFNKEEKIEESNSFIETQITPITRSEDTPVKRDWKKKIVTSLAVVFFISLTGFLVHKSTEPKCMIWKEDHYERIDCEQSSNLGLLKFAQVFPYDEILFDNFKKLTITDTTSFFNKNGDPIVWYSKQNNDCEYFTWEGIHPISRKKLKPISRTIINNYILKWNEKQSN